MSWSEHGVLIEAARLASLRRGCLEADACLYEGLLYSIDGYGAGESVLPWMTLEDWGWKALVAAASDIVAAGGEPVAALYSVGVRRPGEVLEIAKGIGEAADWLGVAVLGGDTNRCVCGDAWIDVAVVGMPLRWVTWRGAKPGMAVVQIGYTGYGAIAQLLLEGRIEPGDVPEAIIEYTRRPTPPVAAARVLASCGAVAAIDNSDGWLWSLYTIAKSSGVGINLEEVHVEEAVAGILEGLGLGVSEQARVLLSSAEDYNVAAVFPRESVECALEACKRHGIKCWVVGGTTGETGVVRWRGEALRPRGWDSFEAK